MFGLNARVNGILDDFINKFLIGELIKFGTEQSLRGIVDDAQFLTDGNSGILMVTGDHNDLDTRALALLNGCLYFGTNGVDHTGKTDENKLFFKIFRLKIAGNGIIFSHGAGKHTQSLIRHTFVIRGDLRTESIGHGNDLTVHKRGGAELENNIGSTLSVLHDAVGRIMYRGHHLSAGIEGSFAHTGEGNNKIVFVKTELISISHESRLGGLTRYLALGVNIGVAAKSHGGGKKIFIITVVIHHGHLILRKSTGLIGTDDLRTAESFHRGEFTDQSLTFAHGGNADGKDDGNNSRKTFGNSGNGKSDGGYEGIKNRTRKEGFEFKSVFIQNEGFNDTHHEDEYADAENKLCKERGKLRHLFLKGGLLFFGIVERIGDLTHFGIHTNCRNDRPAASVNDRGTGIHHVLSVTESNILRAVFQRKDIHDLGYGNGFAGKRGFFHLHGERFQHTAVRRYGIARLQNNDIADNDILTLNGNDLAVAQDMRSSGSHLHQSFHGGFRFTLLHKAHDRVDDNDHKDNKNIGKIFDAGFSSRFQHGYNSLNESGNKEHDDHGVLKGINKFFEKTVFFGFF